MAEPISRRAFLAGSAGAAAAASLGARPRASEKAPHILFVHTDQLRASALASAGNPFISTPHLDRLAAQSTHFTKAYAANPVCVPARSSWYTGHLSGYHGAYNNNAKFKRELVDLGQWLTAAGYRSIYVGKWHIPRRARSSFQHFHYGRSHGIQGDATISHAAAGLLENYDDTQPLFLNVGYYQPHDICHWYFEQENRKPTILGKPELPPLPPSWKPTGPEPKVIRDKRQRRSRELSRWTEDSWRYALWAYYRMVEQLDVEIGRLMAALDASKLADRTWVIFSSDHGELCGAHGLILKNAFYDEAARIPFLIRPPKATSGRVDHRHVIHGIDVFPTFCAIAGIDPPEHLPGRDLLPLCTGASGEPDWPTHRVFESGAKGIMVRSNRYKYVTYTGDPIEQFFDMDQDPGELENLTERLRSSETFETHRQIARRFQSSDRSLEIPTES